MGALPGHKKSGRNNEVTVLFGVAVRRGSILMIFMQF